MSEVDTDMMFFNGVDGATGQYSLPPVSPQQFSDAITRAKRGEAENQSAETPETDEEKEAASDQESLSNWFEMFVKSGHYGIKEGHDPKKLEESGWGVIFANDVDAAVVDALKPLLDWRKSQAGEYYKEYSGPEGGFRPVDNKSRWLGRQGGTPGPADPAIVPYYLLIVGDPERIPYRFQTMLDVQYGVGRIHFDNLDEYAQYAQSVVTAEKEQVRLARRMTFFGTSNPDDPATKLSSEQLIVPLRDSLINSPESGTWDFSSFLGEQATKKTLSGLMNGTDLPGLLFTASHGMGFPIADNRLLPHQGALVCQDWPGPRRSKAPVPTDYYFSADDLSADTNLLGMIAFFFACYGAGTPLLDEFAKQAFKDKRVQIAPHPFIARLPKRMLSLPKGGALAVVGHVERAWGHSFYWGKNRSLTAFESGLLALMDGYPIGYACEYFNQRYAEISTELTELLSDVEYGLAVEPLEVASKWTANNDSKNYVVIGDPAVRMMVPEKTGTTIPARPSISLPASHTSGSKIVDFSAPEAEPLAKEPAATAALILTPAAEPVNFSPPGPILSPAQPQIAQTGTPQEMLGKLVSFLGKAIDSATTLEVRTYTSDQVDKVNLNPTGKLEGANLRAMTVIKILGDIEQVVPVENGSVNHDLWDIHQETVRQAQASHNELIQAAISAAASLANLRINK
jgi:hypothetical protein